jgi:predicted TIM-barrel fold metal-dependent hydrolase
MKSIGTATKVMLATFSCSVMLGCSAANYSTTKQERVLKTNGAELDAHTHLISQPLLDGITGGGVATAGAEDLIEQLDAANIKKAVVLGLGYWTLPDDSNAAAENDFTANEVAKYPDRLVGFCGINPLYDSALAEIDRCLKHPNMIGVKLQGGSYDWEDQDFLKSISAVLNRAGEKNAPVLFHVNGAPMAGESMMNVLKVLGENPDTRITIAHAGGALQTEIELYLVAQEFVPSKLDSSNLFMDLSSSLKFYQDAPLSMKEGMVWHFRKWGIDKLFMGSDYLQVAPQQTPTEAIATLARFPFTQAELDTILNNDGSEWLYGK